MGTSKEPSGVITRRKKQEEMREKEQALVDGSRTCVSKAGLLGVALCEGPCRRWYLSLLQTPEVSLRSASKEPQMQELF